MADFTKRIDSFIAMNANSMSKEKGNELFKSDSFDVVELDIDAQIAVFNAHSTRLYTVEVNYYQDPIRSNCSCPYDWGGICKHQVGALLYLKEQVIQKLEEITSSDTSLPQVITNIAALESQKKSPQIVLLGAVGLIDENFGNTIINKFRHQIYGDVVVVDTSANQMVFKIETSTRYWDYYNRDKNTVTIQVKSQDVLLSCNCSSKNRRPCKHMSFTLDYFTTNYAPNTLYQLTPEYRDELFQAASLQTGIPMSEIERYYKFEIGGGGGLTTTKAGKGLLLFDDNSTQKIKKDIAQGFLKKQHFSIDSLDKVTEKQEQIAYVLWLSTEDKLPVIIPVTGKPSPDRLEMKYIKNLSHSSDVLKKDREDTYLLGLINSYKALTEDQSYRPKNQNDDDKKNAFNKFRDLLPLLAHREFVFFLWDNSFVSNKNVKKSSLSRLKIRSETIELFFELSEEDYFHVLTPMLKLGDTKLEVSYFGANRRGNDFNTFGIFYENEFWAFSNLNEAVTAFNFFFSTDQILKAPKKQFDAFYDSIILPLSKEYRMEFRNMVDKKIIQQDLIPERRQVFLSELSNFILFTPQVLYQNEIKTNILNDHSPLSKQGDTIDVYQRNEIYEDEFRALMDGLHPEFSKQHYDEFYYLPIASVMDQNWFFSTFEKLAEADVDIFGINDLKSIKYSPYQAKISTGIKSGIDWFDVEIKISFGDEQIKLTTLKKAIMRNERFVKLSDGKLGVLSEEWFNKLQKIFRSGELKKGEVKISKLRFNIVDELFDDIDDAKIIKELAAKKKKLKKFTQIKNVEIPDNIQAELRDYQVAGFNWMNFLDEFKWGGLLADDMGLGKTLQALTFIKKMSEKYEKPNLAVVPTSLLYNWQNEIKKFVPDLKYIIYHGGDRKELKDSINEQNLVITSYGVITNDIEELKNISFNYVFLDESQAIKNMASKRYKACRLIKAENRVAMTGTPIENNTFDLYAQMNFLNPGFLGMATTFKTEYSKPIDGKGDKKIAKELQRMIAPFLLRRTKDQVAKELPPKIEDYIYCEMEEEQMSVYTAFRNKYRDYLLNKIEEDGLNKSKLHVLEGLLKLRQICDSPALLADKEDYGSQSVKIKTLLQHIREKTGNHKILIFSQFVKMLHLIRTELEKEGIVFEYLDGQCSPSKRNDSVENFQNNEKCRVFLISLKAGGTGLNLTAADYVYLVDPWWNPAVENQAIDRTHRIGQDKHIIAYRMICKGTVEEKIMQYQQRKLKVAADIVQAEESFMKALSSTDITDLFG